MVSEHRTQSGPLWIHLKAAGGVLMKFGKLSVFFLVLLLVTAQFTVSSGTQDQTSSKTEAPETAAADSSLNEDIFKNPLKPPDTSSPRATL